MDNEKAIKILRKGYPDIKRYATIELGAYEYDVEAYNEALNLAIKTLEERPQGECRTCRHRDPEDKKCDCGGLERQGCPFPVSDDYYCKYFEKGGAE